MDTKKITETKETTEANESASWLLIQEEIINGESIKVFRRASTGALIEALLRSGSFNAEDGVGIESIVQTTTSNDDGGENVITITLTNGDKTTFKAKNGSTGKTAFQYAKDAGYTGSEAEFSSKLANNEIYFGDDEVMPDDCNLQIFSDDNDVSEEYAPVNHNHDGVYIKQTELDDAVNTALAIAKENGDFNGKDGETPYIGANGNWWVGVTDTGVSAGNQGGSIGSVVLTDDGDGNFILEVK